MSLQNISTFTNDSAEKQALDRQRQLALLLQNQSMQPIEGASSNGIQAPISPLQGLAKMLQAYVGTRMNDSLDQKHKELSDKNNQALIQGLSQYQNTLNGTPAVEGKPEVPAMPERPYSPQIGTTMPLAPTPSNIQPEQPIMQPAQQGQPAIPSQPAVPGDRQAAMAQLLASSHPLLQQLGAQQIAAEPERQQRMDEFALKRQDTQEQRDQQAKQFQMQLAAQEQARREQLESRKELAMQADQTRRDLAAQSDATRRDMMTMANAQKQQQNVPKLPTPALKLQQEELDAIGTADAIKSDLGAIRNQIDTGKLKLGVASNLGAKARNFAGMSDENSRNFQSFQSTLEKLRNDSLRLNKGVQTEGDAQRAWNELIANINDPNVVRQRLTEIQKINDRAANLRKNNVDVIRSNFGLDPLDVSAYQNQPPAVGSQGSPNIEAILNKYK